MEFWDKNLTAADIKNVLKNDTNPRFVEIAALFLSRINEPKEVFSRYLSKPLFCRNWQKIKKRMRRNNWNDNKIIFWDEIYKFVVEKSGDELVRETRKVLNPLSIELKKVGDIMKEARRRSGMTQDELAQKTRISQQTISHMERGRVNISYMHLDMICKALDLEIRIVAKTNFSSSSRAFTSNMTGTI